jgi:predicted metal-dependent enzyme (double-stranded beta helix superfamily)
MSRAEERENAIDETLQRVRAIIAGQGVDPTALAEVKTALIALASRDELFTESDFPPPGKGGDRMYTLSIDPDDRFALYLDCSDRDAETPPHNHTTWAVIAGVRGGELNRLYRVEGEAPDGGRGPLVQSGEQMVEPGSGVAFMPDDFHSIHLEGGRLNMNLHLYGLGLHRLKDRVKFDAETGQYSWFAPHPDTTRSLSSPSDPR